jgi:pyrophosphatase PpaX
MSSIDASHTRAGAQPVGWVIRVDEACRQKQDVESVLAALGADPGRAVYVGDSPHDVASGRDAGVRTGAALWGPFPREWLARERPDHWLARPADVLAL